MMAVNNPQPWASGSGIAVSGSGKITEQRHVLHESDRAMDALKGLAGLVDTLDQRLTPILRTLPPEPSGPPSTATPSDKSDIRSKLDAVCDVVMVVDSHVRRLLSRLDLP